MTTPILNEDGNRAALLPGTSQPGNSVLSVLVISEPQVEDSGEYQCRIVSLDMSESIQLTVSTLSSPSSSSSPSPSKYLFASIHIVYTPIQRFYYILHA